MVCILWEAYNKNGHLVNFKPKTKVILIKSFDNKLFILNNSIYYKLIEFSSHMSHSKEFDLDVEPPKKKKIVVPATHTWKETSYNAMLARITNRSR